MWDALECSKLRVALRGVNGGCRTWLPAAIEERTAEKYSPEPSRTGERMGGGVYGGMILAWSSRRTGERRLLW